MKYFQFIEQQLYKDDITAWNTSSKIKTENSKNSFPCSLVQLVHRSASKFSHINSQSSANVPAKYLLEDHRSRWFQDHKTYGFSSISGPALPRNLLAAVLRPTRVPYEIPSPVVLRESLASERSAKNNFVRWADLSFAPS